MDDDSRHEPVVGEEAGCDRRMGLALSLRAVVDDSVAVETQSGTDSSEMAPKVLNQQQQKKKW